MNIWTILEIKETKDKAAIQAAYRAKLVKTHPEDDPEGFMELRESFEEALKLADMTETADDGDEEPHDWGDGPAGLWMSKVNELYNDFARRVDPSEWRKLLNEDVCVNVDTKIEVRNLLLEYMMEHFFLPQDVMQVLDEEFGLIENMDDLKEDFPEEFLDYIIVRGVRYTESPLYRLLKGDTSCDFDGYLNLNAELNKNIDGGNAKKAHALIDEMLMMGITDPYIKVSRAKVLCQEERYGAALEEINYVIEEYPEINEGHLIKGDICITTGDFESAAAAFSVVLERESDDQWARFGTAKCLTYEGKYKEANRILSDIAEDNPYDSDVIEALNECNDKYIEQLKNAIKENENPDDYLELAWCYYQNDKYDEAMRVLEGIDADDEHRVEYLSIIARSALYAEDYDKALRYMKEWETALNGSPHLTRSEEKNSNNMAFCLLMQSHTYCELGDMKNAARVIEMALEQEPDDRNILVEKGIILYSQWHLEEAAECFTRAIELDPDVHGPYIMRARTLFHMEYLADAFDDCEKALELFLYEISAHELKVKILTAAGEFDEANEVLDFLESEEVSGSVIDYLKAYVMEAEGSEDDADEIYKKIIKEYTGADTGDDGISVRNIAEVYHHRAVIAHNKKYWAYSTVMNLIEKGLKEDAGYIPLLELKAEVLEEYEKYEEALSVYKVIEEKAPGRIGIYGSIDVLYRELEDWEKALEYAEKQLSQTEYGYTYMRRGQILAYLGRNEEAEHDFEKAINMDPELARAYDCMGRMKDWAGDEDAALEYFLEAVKVGEREEDVCDEAYAHAADLLCRKNDFAGAMDMLERGFELSEDPDFLLSQVYVCRLSGDFDRARRSLLRYSKENRIRKSSAEYVIQLAHTARNEGDLKKAFKLYSSISEEDTEAGLEAGKILYYNGKYDEALEYFLDAAELFLMEDNDPEIIYLMGEHYLWAARAARDGGNQEYADELAEEGMTYITDEYEKYHRSAVPMVEKILGGLHAISGNREKAREYLKSALNRRKCDYCSKGYCTDACMELAYLNLLDEDYDSASDILEKALTYSKWDADIRGLKRILENRKS